MRKTTAAVGGPAASGLPASLQPMVSPLSWMPLAVMALGAGDAPLYFLLAFGDVWPIRLNTAAGVGRLNPDWLLLARSLAAIRSETLLRVEQPRISADVPTGSAAIQRSDAARRTRRTRVKMPP